MRNAEREPVQADRLRLFERDAHACDRPLCAGGTGRRRTLGPRRPDCRTVSRAGARHAHAIRKIEIASDRRRRYPLSSLRPTPLHLATAIWAVAVAAKV